MSYLCLQNMRVSKSGEVSYTAVSMYNANSIDSTFRPNLQPNVDFFFRWIVRKIVGNKQEKTSLCSWFFCVYEPVIESGVD